MKKKLKNDIKSEKGISGIDVVTAVILLTLFSGIILTLMFNSAKLTNEIRANAIATGHIIEIFEDIDLQAYENVNSTYANSTNLKNKFNISDSFNITMVIEKYSDLKPGKKDILKKITLQISYNIGNGSNSQETIIMSKLKIKE